jgi:translation initiation factor 1
MGRDHDSRRKVDVSRPAAPLQSNPFAVLGEVEALKNLAPEAAAPKPLPVPPAAPRKARGRLVLRRETKDRGGKVVVVVHGFAELPGANAVMIADLARELKGRLGCGGSFDRQEIVLQGDRCAEVCAALEGLGFRVDGVRA